jgi:hypothetical protein
LIVRRNWVWSCLPIALFVLGCSEGGPEIVPVSGTVLLDGKPVSGAGVLFTPVADGPLATGTTDDQGRYSLTTGERAGAVPGEHQVTITLMKTSGLITEEGGLSGGVAPGGVKTEWFVPQKYSRPETSGLTATVASDEKEYNFDLKSK